MPRVVLDVRCLQDPAYARRGVGRHALALLLHAPTGLRLEGLVDPGLPPLLEEARERLSAVHSNAYAAAVRPLDGFVSLSPMTHDALFVARLLSDRRVSRVAVVYDFIPSREPERYLPKATDRLANTLSLQWLARHDVFAPISRAAGDDLVALLGVAAHKIAVTGAPVAGVFEVARALRAGRRPRHLLVVGGGDPRKNPEVVIRAHARSSLLQAARIPLVVAGDYRAHDAAAFRTLARASGGDPDLVEVPGHVSELALLETYALAHAIICPSRDEGFSLPVVEGMAAGLPCVASDIPAQCELVEDPALRFPPDDDGRLSGQLERIIADEGWRENVLRGQAQMWPRFRAEEVGRRFWNAIVPGLTSRRAPAVLRGHRPRVALLSPVPPDRSGVAEYTAATCGPLGELVDLHVFTTATKPAPLRNVASVRPLSSLPHAVVGFDRVVSVVGNSHFHTQIFEKLLRYGGACIAHDSRMLSFYSVIYGAERAQAVASRELKRTITGVELRSWIADERKAETALLSEIVASASPMIVHSPLTCRYVEQRHGRVPVYLPFSIYRPWHPEELTPARRLAARSRLRIAENEVTIATFGFVHDTKAPEDCIWALEVLRGWGVPASLHFVGSRKELPDGGKAIESLARKIGVLEHIRFNPEEYVDEQVYRDYLLGSDFAIQLRKVGAGAVSGALLDCIAAGLPTVTNVSLAEAFGIPASYTRAVPDALSPLLVAEALFEMLERKNELPEWEAERAAYSQMRSFDTYAQRLCDAIGVDVGSKKQKVV